MIRMCNPICIEFLLVFDPWFTTAHKRLSWWQFGIMPRLRASTGLDYHVSQWYMCLWMLMPFAPATQIGEAFFFALLTDGRKER